MMELHLNTEQILALHYYGMLVGGFLFSIVAQRGLFYLMQRQHLIEGLACSILNVALTLMAGSIMLYVAWTFIGAQNAAFMGCLFLIPWLLHPNQGNLFYQFSHLKKPLA
jgi:hypothetical protein